jgi:hypothetical protein
MAKKTTKAVETAIETVVTPVAEATKTTLEDLSKEELACRYQANVEERKRLAEENKVLCELYKSANSTAKKTAAEKKIAELQAKLAALTNPTPVVSEPVTEPTAEAPSEELAG